jgi:CubicO group peptidase (beta-lactamase class C family)
VPGPTPIEWTECDPRSASARPAGLAEAVRLVEARGALAQLCVLRGGRVLLDRSFGCRPDALFWIFSVSKPYVAVLVHQLAERGLLSLDDPVAAHWPEFAGGGKAAVTVRDVLAHRSGMPTAGSVRGDAIAVTDWRLSVRRIERARLRTPPGAVPAYSPLAYGFVLGELVARVTGRPVTDVLHSELLAPLGLADTHLGLPPGLWSRHVPLRVGAGDRARAGLAGPLVAAAMNRRAFRRAVVPAAGVSTTARDLALFYRAMLAVRAGERPDVLGAPAMAAALEPTTEGEVDRTSGVPIRWGLGFQLGGPRHAAGAVSAMGALSSPLAFGHNGSNCCIAWADPDRDLVYAYLTNRLADRDADKAHHVAVADAVLGACDGAVAARPGDG